MQRPIREKAHRLNRSCYQGEQTIAFTACLHRRAAFWTSGDVVGIGEEMLRAAFGKQQARIVVSCFMPDHLHVIARGETPHSDLWRAMVDWKQRSGFWLSREYPEVRWQKDFYDSIIRSQTELNHQIRYILLNPVRAELVAQWRDYPFTGPDEIKGWEWD